MSNNDNNKNSSSSTLDFNNIDTSKFKSLDIPNNQQFQQHQQHNKYYDIIEGHQQQQHQQRPHHQQQYNSNNNNNNNRNNPYGRQHQQQQQQYREETSNNEYYNYTTTIKKQNQVVANHYDNKQNTPIHIRAKSKIISLKNINNWVKSILIQEYSKPNATVLDICGGKLGDLQKWIKADIKSLIVSDISLESLKHGAERYNQGLNYIHFDLKMIAVDCFSSKLLDSFPKVLIPPPPPPPPPKQKKQQKNNNNNNNDDDESSSESEEEEEEYEGEEPRYELVKVDLVSCQFALHYSFRTEESARSLLNNVSSVLKDGGYFIGTMPNACLIVKKFKKSDNNKFGNDVYSIEFKEKEPKLTAFGSEYKFYLEDAIDFLEEYLVHIDVLIELAKEYQLELVEHTNFHDFIYEKSKNKQSYELMQKMGCFNRESNTISISEWEALGIYKTFVFRKIGNNTNNNNNDSNDNNSNNNNNNNFKAKIFSNDDIIINL